MDPFFEYLKIWFLSDKPQDLVDQKWNEATMPIARFKCTLNYVSSHPTVHTAIEWAGFESGIFYINWKTLFEKLKNICWSKTRTQRSTVLPRHHQNRSNLKLPGKIKIELSSNGSLSLSTHLKSSFVHNNLGWVY